MNQFVVSPLGNDAYAGNESYPFRTFTKASQVLQPGDICAARGGEYIEKIQPARSGLQGAPITYRAYQQEPVVIADVAQGAVLNRDWIILNGIGFTGRNYANPTMVNWAMITGSHNILLNCKGQYAGGEDAYGGVWIEQSAGYTQLLSSEFSEKNGIGEVIRIEGHHTLIDTCKVHKGFHNCIGMMPDHPSTQFLIVTNSELWNEIYRAASWGQPNDLPCFVVFEKNHVHNCVSGPQEQYIADGIQINGKFVIVRRNLFRDIDGCGMLLDSWPWEYQGVNGVYKHGDCYLYHNTVSRCGKNLAIEGPNPAIKIRYRTLGDSAQPTGMFPPGTFRNIGIKNNIFYQNPRPTPYYEIEIPSAEQPYDFAGNWHDAEGDPDFVDPTNHDYHLREGSGCIGSGVFLTRTRSGGSGQEMPVEKSGYFHDGYGMVPGDFIQLEGESEPVQILVIEHATNTLFLERSVEWSAGQGVALPYKGNAPSKGAFEYYGGTMADKKITLNLKVLAAPDFYLSADAATKNVTVGGTVAFEIAVNPLAGFSGNVLLNLTPSQWPAGISASFNRSVVPAGETAILTIVVAADAMLVDFNFDVTPTI